MQPSVCRCRITRPNQTPKPRQSLVCCRPGMRRSEKKEDSYTSSKETLLCSRCEEKEKKPNQTTSPRSHPPACQLGNQGLGLRLLAGKEVDVVVSTSCASQDRLVRVEGSCCDGRAPALLKEARIRFDTGQLLTVEVEDLHGMCRCTTAMEC